MAEVDEDGEVPGAEEIGTPEDEVEQPDPRDAELERLRQREQQLLEHALARLEAANTPAPPAALREVEPDFNDADDVGLTPAQAKYLYGKTMAVQAVREEKLRRELSAPRPKPIDDLVTEFKRKAGRDDLDDEVVEGIAHREARRARAEGVTADHLIEGRIVAAIKQRPVLGASEKKSSTYTGPSGAYSGVRRGKPASKEPGVKTLVEVIKEDRRKRGLSYY